jgi:hypothetical protein
VAAAGIDFGDIDGDGTLDAVASGGTGNDRLAVLHGKGGGSFGAAVLTDNARNAFDQLALVDVDGDGKLDLVGRGAGLLAVRLGKGDGTFGMRADYALANKGVTDLFATGDLNGDGRADVLAFDPSASTITPLLAKGDGTLALQAVAATRATVNHAVVADLDSDGVLDLVSSDTGSATVVVLRGRGDGTFTALPWPKVSIPGTTALTVGDLDSDGVPDILVGMTLNEIAVLIGAGDGTFKASPDVGSFGIVAGLHIDDFNGDALPDILVTSKSDGGVATVMLGVGGGVTGVRKQFFLDRVVRVTDLDGNGLPDFLGVNYNFASAMIRSCPW